MKKNGEFVGVDEKFIPEDEKYVDESIIGNQEESKKKVKKVAKAVITGYIIWIVIIMAIILGTFIFSIKFTIKDSSSKKITNYNYQFEMYEGIKGRIMIQSLLEEIITNNKNNSDKTVTLKYGDTVTSSKDKILEISESLESFSEYEVGFEYNKEGLINKITIEKN